MKQLLSERENKSIQPLHKEKEGKVMGGVDEEQTGSEEEGS